MSGSETTYELIAEVVRRRRTFKVLGDPQRPISIPSDHLEQFDPWIWRAIEDAGFAPFHYDRKMDGIAEPWRAYHLSCARCRTIAQRFTGWFPDLKPGNKMPAMLSACGALVLVTWLPQDASEIADAKKREEVNNEHLAAASAFVQSLLLLLESRGLGTYWSSGGLLADGVVFDDLKIARSERLLAAVFVEYPHTKGMPLERLPGSNHVRRQPATRWARVIE